MFLLLLLFLFLLAFGRTLNTLAKLCGTLFLVERR
jgi:hypothetical protein